MSKLERERHESEKEWDKEVRRMYKENRKMREQAVESMKEIFELEEAVMAMGTDSEHEQDMMANDRRKRKVKSTRRTNRAQRKADINRRSKEMRMRQFRKTKYENVEFESESSSEEDKNPSIAEQMLPW